MPSVKGVRAGRLSSGRTKEHADGKHGRDAEFDEGAEVIARGQKEPDRESAGEEAVGDEHEREGGSAIGEPRSERGGFGNPLAAEDAGEDEDETDDGDFDDAAGAQVAQVEAHEDGDGHGGGEGEGAPGAALEGVGDDQPNDGHEEDHDKEDSDHGGEAAGFGDFLLDHLTEAFAVAADGEGED